MPNKENKNIDQFFKDRLQGMETPPPPVVWENIQEALGRKKRERKVIPLWWKLGGIAAALVLLFSVANLFMSQDSNSFIGDENQLVLEDTEKATQDSDSNNSSEETKKGATKSGVITTPTIHETSVASEIMQNEIDLKNNITTPTSYKSSVNKNQYKNTKIVTVKEQQNHVNQDKLKVITGDKLITQAAVASADKSLNSSVSNTLNANKELLLNKEDENKANEIITGPIKDAVAKEDLKNTDKLNKTVDKEVILKDNDKSIFDAIAEQKEAVVKTDDEMPTNRWSVSPNVAPVYYNSLSQGSSIDPSFADNTQNGEVNMSYGINLSYALTKRLTIRSGVSNVNLSYATGGLELATGDASAALQSVTFPRNGIVVTAVDRGALDNAAGTPFENLTRKATDGDVFLTQSISYTEIPTELTYALVNKKIGINLIGGFSTLLLGNNEVAVSANNFEDVLGEANNLSDVSFSTNVGLGLSYQLSRKFKFNVEPMFKYQLNPYTDNSVQFKPYYVGIYSGLSFKF